MAAVLGNIELNSHPSVGGKSYEHTTARSPLKELALFIRAEW
jgi:hypothetical protein